MRIEPTSLLPGALLAALALPPAVAGAQGPVTGQVRAAATGRPLAGAEVTLPGLGLRARTDSAGRYRLLVPVAGRHLRVVLAAGYRPDSSMVTVGAGVATLPDVLLAPVVVLDEVSVTAPRPVPARMRAFEERRLAGSGHFIDRALLEKHADRQTGDIIGQHAPGTRLVRGQSRVWVASGRALGAGRCVMCRDPMVLDLADAAAGAKPACYMDVYLDGTLVYSSAQRGGAPLFDVNSLRPEQIEGIEIYTGPAQLPPQFNRTGGGCGAMLIWTRIS